MSVFPLHLQYHLEQEGIKYRQKSIRDERVSPIPAVPLGARRYKISAENDSP